MTLATFGFSSPWIMLLLESRYFWTSNFACKHKEMSMTQLNILESRGFFIVLLLHGATSFLVFSLAIFSHNFLHVMF